jgi:hypothetical protein
LLLPYFLIKDGVYFTLNAFAVGFLWVYFVKKYWFFVGWVFGDALYIFLLNLEVY